MKDKKLDLSGLQNYIEDAQDYEDGEYDVGRYHLEGIPSIVCKLDLEELYLYHIQINKIPECIGELTGIRRLGTGNNSLSSVPDSICELENREFLEIYKCQLQKLPDNIGQLINLKSYLLPIISLNPYQKVFGS